MGEDTHPTTSVELVWEDGIKPPQPTTYYFVNEDAGPLFEEGSFKTAICDDYSSDEQTCWTYHTALHTTVKPTVLPTVLDGMIYHWFQYGLRKNYEHCLAMGAGNDYSINTHTFLADTGASVHMGGMEEGMFDITHVKSQIKVGDGKFVESTKTGKLRCQARQKDGSLLDLVLSPYKLVPELWVNLFAVLQSCSSG